MNFLTKLGEKPKDLLVLCGAAAALLLWNLGGGSLASWDEANYALAAKLILETGDWILFRWPGGGYFLDKPPIFMWAVAAGYKLFGVGEFASRLPSALGGIGLVAVTYWIGCRLYGRWAGFAAAGILLGTTDFLRYARFGTLDVLQLLFFSAAILAYLGTRDRASRWWWFWLASGLCFMTKGALIVLAWAAIAAHFCAENRWHRLRVPQFWLGILLFLLIVLPWHVAAFRLQPEIFWNDFIVKNYVTRGTAVLDGHQGNSFFYLRVLVNKYQPWIFLAPVALGAAVLRLVRGKAEDRPREVLLVSWVLIVFLFFNCAVQTKLNWYILPLHPALSILTGVCLAGWLKDRGVWIRTAVLAGLAAHVIAGSAFAVDYSAGIQRLAPVIHSRVPAYETVYLYDYHEQPAALFYWDRPVRYADSLSELDAVLKREKSVRLVIQARAFEPQIREFTRRGFHVVVRTETSGDKLYLLETR